MFDCVSEISSFLKMGFYNIVFLGHVDSGKSSLCGTILVESGSVDVRRAEEAERDAEASAGKGCFW